MERNLKHNNIQNVITYNNACGNDIREIGMPVVTDVTKPINMGDFTPNFIVLLDNVCSSYKIDVQGWEKYVLLGADNILKSYKPVLIVEFESFHLQKTNTSCKELFDFIKSKNYYIFYLEYEYPSDHVCA